MSKFTQEELEILKQYVTDPESNVFAVKGLAGIIGPVYARYSRAKGSFLETFLKEFIKEGQLDPVKAKEVIERILIAFGDDSVGELEGAHLSLEQISKSGHQRSGRPPNWRKPHRAIHALCGI